MGKANQRRMNVEPARISVATAPGGLKPARNPPKQNPNRPENPTFQPSPEVKFRLLVVYTCGFVSTTGSQNGPTMVLPLLQCSHTGFEKPHERALELVYRAEKRCKSIGARAGGLFQALLGPIWPAKTPKFRFLDLKQALKFRFLDIS